MIQFMSDKIAYEIADQDCATKSIESGGKKKNIIAWQKRFKII